MKIIKTASGKQTIKMNRSEWEAIGRKAAWYDPEEIKKNMDEFYSTTQDRNPNASDFAVDPRIKHKSIPANIKSLINSILHEIGRKYWDSFPLEEIFNACKEYGVIPLQEDGTKWAGMIGSQGECGHDKPPMTIDLAVRNDEGRFVQANNRLIITACTMSSNKVEVVVYIN